MSHTRALIALLAVPAIGCTHVETVERGGHAVAWAAAPSAAPLHSDRRALHDALVGAVTFAPDKLKPCVGKQVSIHVVADESVSTQVLGLAEQALYRTLRNAGCQVASTSPNRAVLTVAAHGWEVDASQTETTSTTYIFSPVAQTSAVGGSARVRARATVILDLAVDGGFQFISAEHFTDWRTVDGPAGEYWPRSDMPNLDKPTPRRKPSTSQSLGSAPASSPILSAPVGDF